MPAAIPQSSEVLIVGAGPTGLMAAICLAKQGRQVKIIDKNIARSDKSKALGVQAGTLECLGAIDEGLRDNFIRAGHRAFEAWVHLDESPPIRIDLRTIPSAYNFILILEQSETERILEEYLNGLGVFVERQCQLSRCTDSGSDVLSILELGGNRLELKSLFVVGCDGAHSEVRHLLNIPFEGGQYTGDFLLGDVTLEWKESFDSIHTFVSSRGVIAAFPMRGDKKYRLIVIPQARSSEDESQSELSVEEFRQIVEFVSQGKIQVRDSNWLTRFRVHHRIVSELGRGRIFLAGDAAHIHSPAGGQGMNTGMQDALNLCTKIARVLKGEETLARLADYTAERLPVARKVLRSTDLVFRLAVMPQKLPVRWIRRWILPSIAGLKWVQRLVATAVSEIHPARQEIARLKALPTKLKAPPAPLRP